ncbi:MAG TPA: TetR/AcrR family transcriptional regulator [Thermoanaerobaculia bacterium]|nr:TetR/AcrR family transcriptional regulator [Thermoanaerobaculia bacterium]
MISSPQAITLIAVTVHDAADSTQTSRSRLLAAGKSLFAKSGYEQTSTAAIAREAGSSESQLIRYFNGKAGLLEAIFNESWGSLNELFSQQIGSAVHGRDAILKVLSLLIQAFSRDHDIAFLFLFEGRRMRGGAHEVMVSKGFQTFTEAVDGLIERGRADGSFRTDIQKHVLFSAMLGCAEGMIRDRVLAERNNVPLVYDDQEIVRTFTAMVNGLAPLAELKIEN